jgi:biopolymer transport protein ExbD
MAIKSRRKPNEDPKLEMTPMIDVVFQLLIFFIVTLKQEDIMARLMASRPAPDPNAVPENQPELINITVHRGGFIFRGKPLTLEGLDRQVERCAELSKKANVIVRCTADSPHRFLVQTLDICNKHGMVNLSIFSM